MSKRGRKPWLVRVTPQTKSELDLAVMGFSENRERLWRVLGMGAELCEVWPEASRRITGEMRHYERTVKSVRALLAIRCHRDVFRQIALALWAERGA